MHNKTHSNINKKWETMALLSKNTDESHLPASTHIGRNHYDDSKHCIFEENNRCNKPFTNRQIASFIGHKNLLQQKQREEEIHCKPFKVIDIN